MVDRVIGVITLKSPTFREIACDPTATREAITVVLVSSLIAGFFRGLYKSFLMRPLPQSMLPEV